MSAGYRHKPIRLRSRIARSGTATDTIIINAETDPLTKGASASHRFHAPQYHPTAQLRSVTH
tara:strand:- start:5982 stop:6167 length:186 start_codon:yes stop_codon:yes gene_type:complete